MASVNKLDGRARTSRLYRRSKSVTVPPLRLILGRFPHPVRSPPPINIPHPALIPQSGELALVVHSPDMPSRLTAIVSP
ncbi:hypothetical protein RRG08_028947 [Elysia crispata]|uniref:Uncharacterized protein n=1 Tax=Elysia crispata TaxID=231223 RepID=A0AAE1APZ8_9GAST|nr:hypothetical protein RRG08_028947 [Elysia crispata]